MKAKKMMNFKEIPKINWAYIPALFSSKENNKQKVETSMITNAEKKDGIDYINIWNKGETELGRMLSHFYSSPFLHPYYGHFNSMEGFWHYIRTIEKDDRLRNLSGIKAKTHGRTLTQDFVHNFCDIINEANFYKIEQNPKIKEMFINSTLPFEFYYLFGKGNIIIHPNGCEWLIEGFEVSRNLMREGKRLPDVEYIPV